MSNKQPEIPLNEESKGDNFFSEVPKKLFTVNSFLTNPTGDNGTIATARKATLDVYKTKFNKLLKERKAKVKIIESNKRLFFLLTIPSESFEEMTYEVIIEFLNWNSDTGSLNNLNIAFFSNAPSFTFTYAHVFDKFGILIEDFKSKYEKEIFTNVPVTRNPDYRTFYEKSITFALLYIQEHNLLNPAEYKINLEKLPFTKFKELVSTSQEKINQYKILKAKASKKDKEDSSEGKKKKNLDKVTKISQTHAKIKNLDTKKVSRVVKHNIDNRVNNKLNTKVKNKVNMKLN